MAKTTDVTVNIKGRQTVTRPAKDAGRSIDTLREKVMTFGRKGGAAIAVVTASTAGLALALAKLTKDAAKLQMTERAFSSLARNAGTSADEVIGHLEKMTKGTISQADLMASATKAISFNIPIERFGDMAEAARVASISMGESTAKMLDDLITGVARQSPMIIDNLGLQVKMGAAMDKLAETTGKSVEEFSAADRTLALLNATMDAANAQAERLGDTLTEVTQQERLERFGSSWKNLIQELTLSFGFFAEKSLGPALDDATSLLQKWAAVIAAKTTTKELQAQLEVFKLIADQNQEINLSHLSSQELIQLQNETIAQTNIAMAAQSRDFKTWIKNATQDVAKWFNFVGKMSLFVGNPLGRDRPNFEITKEQAEAAQVFFTFMQNRLAEELKNREMIAIAEENNLTIEGERLNTAKETTEEVQKQVDAFQLLSSKRAFVLGPRESAGFFRGIEGAAAAAGEREPTAEVLPDTSNKLVDSFLAMIGGIDSVIAVLDPLGTIFGGIKSVLEPVINTVLAPLIGAFKQVGVLIGSLIVPILKALEPVLTFVVELFVGFYNLMVPVFNVLITIFNVLGAVVAHVVNALSSIVRIVTFGFINIPDVKVPSANDNTLSTISTDSLATLGDTDTTATASTGSSTTVQQAPDIFFTQNINGPNFFSTDLEELGETTNRALEAFVQSGGKLNFLEA